MLACGEQPGSGTLGFHPGGRHAGHGAELVFGFVAGTGNEGAAVGLGVAATVGAIVGLGVAITAGDALGPGGGTAGSTAKAVDASPAVINRLSKTDAPKRVARDDIISLRLLPGCQCAPARHCPDYRPLGRFCLDPMPAVRLRGDAPEVAMWTVQVMLVQMDDRGRPALHHSGWRASS